MGVCQLDNPHSGRLQHPGEANPLTAALLWWGYGLFAEREAAGNSSSVGNHSSPVTSGGDWEKWRQGKQGWRVVAVSSPNPLLWKQFGNLLLKSTDLSASVCIFLASFWPLSPALMINWPDICGARAVSCDCSQSHHEIFTPYASTSTHSHSLSPFHFAVFVEIASDEMDHQLLWRRMTPTLSGTLQSPIWCQAASLCS